MVSETGHKICKYSRMHCMYWVVSQSRGCKYIICHHCTAPAQSLRYQLSGEDDCEDDEAEEGDLEVQPEA